MESTMEALRAEYAHVKEEYHLTADEYDKFCVVRDKIAPVVQHHMVLAFLFNRHFDIPSTLERIDNYMRVFEELKIRIPMNMTFVQRVLENRSLIPLGPGLDGSEVILFLQRKHDPLKFSLRDLVHAFLALIEVACRREQTLREGFTFIADMTESGWENFDMYQHRQLLRILTKATPVKFTNAFVADTSLLFRAAYQVLQPFVPKKLRDRVHFVDLDVAKMIVASYQWPIEYGGKQELSAAQWIAKALHTDYPYELFRNVVAPPTPKKPMSALRMPTASGPMPPVATPDSLAKAMPKPASPRTAATVDEGEKKKLDKENSPEPPQIAS